MQRASDETILYFERLLAASSIRQRKDAVPVVFDVLDATWTLDPHSPGKFFSKGARKDAPLFVRCRREVLHNLLTQPNYQPDYFDIYI